MKKHWSCNWISIILLPVVLLTLLAISCAPKSEMTGKISIVVTILPQVEFVQSVGGEKVDAIVMVPPGQDPHTYAPTPSQLAAVKQAKMYAMMGSGVEFELAHMDRIEAANKHMLLIDCSKGIDLIHNDPHTWLSPRNAKIMVENIYDGLIKVDPTNEEYYVNKKYEYLLKLDKLDKEIEARLVTITNKYFMVLHPAWGYFARDYGLEQIAIHIEGKNPSAQDIVNLVQKAKEHNIKVVFTEPQFDTRSASTIAKAIGGTVVCIDPLAKDYIDNMYRVLDALVKGMH